MNLIKKIGYMARMCFKPFLGFLVFVIPLFAYLIYQINLEIKEFINLEVQGKIERIQLKRTGPLLITINGHEFKANFKPVNGNQKGFTYDVDAGDIFQKEKNSVNVKIIKASGDTLDYIIVE